MKSPVGNWASERAELGCTLNNPGGQGMEPRRLDRLDQLRFVGCFAVMAWHFTPHYVPTTGTPRILALSLIEEGHAGVALFFVISGFIFAHLYGQRDVAYWQFMAKRALRILPMFVLMTALVFYVNRNWPAGQMLSLLSTMQVENLPGYLGPAWSLLVEFQFYFLLPFLLLFVRQSGLRYLLGLWAVFVVLRILVWAHTGNVQQLSYWTMFGRADQFIAGMIAGYLYTQRAVRSQRVAWCGLAAAVAAVGLLAAFYAKINLAGGYYGLRPSSVIWVVWPTVDAVLFSVAVLGYLVAPRIRAISGSWLSEATSYLGRISFSMYVLHVLIFAVIQKKTVALYVPTTWEGAALLYVAVGLPAVVAVSALTYQFIERPFMKIGRREPPHRVEVIQMRQTA